ncbi:DUF6722 family protein [Geoalkalibacter subterraneus]|uniref:Uncharacterized protein n=1 Tax=Geoalkalibacter subterraneus TaxID=483547 RepID=A0A0B5FU09_9BACT|nr:DUF6722 family protein [Geoalkalibacter subterraneus]AJF08159.1 hypothetical protein GSUB_16795 [Geoalkalibacter subterraneus]
MKWFNRKRKEGFTNYLYEISKLFVAGVGLAGIMQKGPLALIAVGFVVGFFALLLALYLEGDGDSDDL